MRNDKVVFSASAGFVVGGEAVNLENFWATAVGGVGDGDGRASFPFFVDDAGGGKLFALGATVSIADAVEIFVLVANGDDFLDHGVVKRNNASNGDNGIFY